LIRAYRERCEELEEELRQLREQLRAEMTWQDWRLVLPALTPQAAAMLTELHRAYPRPVSREQLHYRARPTGRGDPQLKLWDVIAHRLRTLARQEGAPELLITVYGVGYALTPDGYAWLEAKKGVRYANIGKSSTAAVGRARGVGS
jgi:DNA-binding response OmpR family regulator